MKNARLYLVLVLATLASACSSQSGSNQLSKDTQTIQSWVVTVHTVADEWMKGDVLTPYTLDTFQNASQQLQTEQAIIQKLPDAPDSQRQAVMAQIPSLKQTIDAMAQSVQQNNRAQLGQQIQQLAAQEQSLDETTKQMGMAQ